jgi:hypothetical protein
MRPELEEFARILIQRVRDSAIKSSDMALRPDVEDPVAKRWRAAGVEKAEVVIPDVVDESVFCLLNAIDQGVLHLVFISSNGTKVDLTEEGVGELSGWYMGSGGWRALHSQERFADDIADIAVDR